MRFLIHLAHPAKFHFHKFTINELKKQNHHVDVIINGKDILEDLIKEEGWDYYNFFPEGRKIKSLPILISSVIGLARTIFRLVIYLRGKDYDLFLGNELCFLSKFRDTPSVFFVDDSLKITPANASWFKVATHIFAPVICDIGPYTSKKISYDGYKALAHLHPKRFSPNINKLPKELRKVPFFLIRLCEFRSFHDVGGRKGIDNKTLERLVSFLKKHGKIVISAERELPSKYSKYQIISKKKDMQHYIYYSKLFIGDSLTMCTEAAVLGTPSIDFDDWWEECDQMIELIEKYRLVYGISTDNPDGLLERVKELLNKGPKLNEIFQNRRKKLLNDKIDVSAFQLWFIENYPESFEKLSKNPSIQYEVSK